ncbi:SufB/SufD family protein [Blattabacterium cuenoti]|uniref:SufB/SufD family protein n=1 Tax=Blattabacterium cuenoti TaxID=1653831 RepID=UPI00163D031A|nr:SufD family Fe-S cluster assembly protein [Blattabacterium cuenoti]
MHLKNKINFFISKISSSIKKEKSYISYLQKKHINFFKKKGLNINYISNKDKLIGNTKDINSIFNEENYTIINNDSKYAKKIKYDKIKKFFIEKKKNAFLLLFIDGKYNTTFFEEKNRYPIILSNIISQKEEKIKKYYGKLSYSYDIFYSLNTIFSKDGGYINIPDNIILKNPIEILHIITKNVKSRVMLNIRSLIVVGKNSDVQIIEHYKCMGKNSVFINSVNEIYSLDKSKIKYYKIQDCLKKTSIIDNTFLKQKKDSKCTVYTFSYKGNIIKNNLNFYSCGERSYSYLYGISLLSEEQYLNQCTLINHLFSNSYSYQLYKSILSEKSSVFFNGKIIVKKFISGVNAFQKSNNILLSNSSRAYANPQLKIFSKNVKCSHGCTIGNIKEYELFYLRSRGISEKESKKMILLSFLKKLLSTIDNIELRTFFNKKVNKKIEKLL